MKYLLKDFATLFPIIGVIGADEARKDLWAVCRQVLMMVVGMSEMLTVAYLSQEIFEASRSSLIVWSAYLAVFFSLTVQLWIRDSYNRYNLFRDGSQQNPIKFRSEIWEYRWAL